MKMKHLSIILRTAALMLILASCRAEGVTDTDSPGGQDAEGQPIVFSTTLARAADKPITRSTSDEFPRLGSTLTMEVSLHDVSDQPTNVQTADFVYTDRGWIPMEGFQTPVWRDNHSQHSIDIASPALTAEERKAGITRPADRTYHLPPKFTSENYPVYGKYLQSHVDIAYKPQIEIPLTHPMTRLEVLERSGYEVKMPGAKINSPATDGETGSVRLWDDHGVYRGYMIDKSLPANTIFLTSSYGREVTISESYQPGYDLLYNSLLRIDLTNSLITGASASEIATQLSTVTDGKLTDGMLVVKGPINADCIEAIKNLSNSISGLDADLRETTGLTELGENALMSSNLGSLLLPESVTTLNRGAISNSSSITYASMPGVETIAAAAFSSCQRLSSIDLPKVKSIGSSAFSGTKNLTSLNLPMLESMDGNVFDGCVSLRTLILPRIQKFGKLALQGSTENTQPGLVNLVTDGSQEVTVEEDEEPGQGGLGAPQSFQTLFLTSSLIQNEADIPACWKEIWDWWYIYYGYDGTGDPTNPASYAGYWEAPL